MNGRTEKEKRMDTIRETIQKYIDNGDIAGAAYIVRKNGKVEAEGGLGYADIEKQLPAGPDTLFRLASMTKPIAAIAVMKLIEDGKIRLQDKISTWLPEYRDMKVCSYRVGDEFYAPDPDSPTGAHASEKILNEMTYVDAEREITVYDLMTHSSGIGMGPVGITLAERVSDRKDTIRERVRKYAVIPLDFQPGTEMGYSAIVGMEILSAVIEIISGMSFDEYLEETILGPMGIRDITYSPDEEQTKRIPRLYKYTENHQLEDVTDTDYTWLIAIADPVRSMHSASAGLYGSVAAYDKIAQMLLQGGEYNGVRILKAETVEAICQNAGEHKLWLCPGLRWGLGMVVYDDPAFLQSARSAGSYGWSGAFGTHFFVDPQNRLTAVLGINRSNIGGASSPVSFAFEKAIREELLQE